MAGAVIGVSWRGDMYVKFNVQKTPLHGVEGGRGENTLQAGIEYPVAGLATIAEDLFSEPPAVNVDRVVAERAVNRDHCHANHPVRNIASMKQNPRNGTPEHSPVTSASLLASKLRCLTIAPVAFCSGFLMRQPR